jgi:hypothetical protein
MRLNQIFCRLILLVHLGLPLTSEAGVFNIPKFVEPGLFSIGLEPELTLESNDTGGALNLKYTHGISDLVNVGGVVGFGGGARKFRAGGYGVFDFFPDDGNQPGIGVATQLIHYSVTGGHSLELTFVPYFHKSFKSGESEFDPFFAIPFGVAFRGTSNPALIHTAIGSVFKSSEHLFFLLELGVAINNTNTYFSGGVVYYY